MDSEIMDVITKVWQNMPEDEKPAYETDYYIVIDPAQPAEMRYYHAYVFLRRYLATHTQPKKRGR